MINIKNLVFDKLNFIPTEHREVTLVEFMASVNDSNVINKSGR